MSRMCKALKVRGCWRGAPVARDRAAVLAKLQEKGTTSDLMEISVAMTSMRPGGEHALHGNISDTIRDDATGL